MDRTILSIRPIAMKRLSVIPVVFFISLKGSGGQRESAAECHLVKLGGLEAGPRAK